MRPGWGTGRRRGNSLLRPLRRSKSWGWTCSKAPDRRAAELNEIRWWSKWARLRWNGEGYLLSSAALREPFFNRAGALSCRAVTGTAAWAERILASSGVNSTFLAFDSCASAKALISSGYRQEDTMTVLRSTTPLDDQKSEQVVVMSDDPDAWASTYLRAFYGDEARAAAVRPIVSSLMWSRDTTFLESKIKGTTAGVLAIFRTPGVAGVYCVGTAPEFRRRGVANRLLARARKIADDEGRGLILQTLTSDGALQFYRKRGFVEMHSKSVLVRKLK